MLASLVDELMKLAVDVVGRDVQKLYSRTASFEPEGNTINDHGTRQSWRVVVREVFAEPIDGFESCGCASVARASEDVVDAFLEIAACEAASVDLVACRYRRGDHVSVSVGVQL